MCWFFPLSLKLGNSREWEVIILTNNALVPATNTAHPVHGIREELIWQEHRIHPKHHPLHSRAAAKLPRGSSSLAMFTWASIWTWLGKWARLVISNTLIPHSSKASFPLNLSFSQTHIVFLTCFAQLQSLSSRVFFFFFGRSWFLHFEHSPSNPFLWELTNSVQIKSTSYSVSAKPCTSF